MSIRWDTRNKRWRFEFDRYLQGRRHRLSRLLPRGWSQAQADAYDRTARALCKAVDAATDFAGTVAGGASWWDDVWADHAAALDKARDEITAATGPNVRANRPSGAAQE